jgi:hypothetical protein
MGINKDQVELSKFTDIYPIDIGRTKAAKIDGYKLQEAA